MISRSQVGFLFVAASFFGALAVGCTVGTTTTSGTSTNPSATSTTTATASATATVPTGAPVVDFYMAASQCLTPCPMGSPVLAGASVTIEAVIKNADPLVEYQFRTPNDSNTYVEYSAETCFCDNNLSTVVGCTQSCGGANLITVVSAQVQSSSQGSASVTLNLNDDNDKTIATTSFGVEPAAGLTTGVAASLSPVKAAADGSFTVPAGVPVEITYAPVDANGTPLMFSQNGVSATFSNPNILGPDTTITNESAVNIALGTGNVIYATAGNAGDATIGVSTGYSPNTGAPLVTSSITFHVAQ